MPEINPFEIADYLGDARSRVTEQFKDKDIFDRHLRLLLSGEVEIQEVLKQLMQLRSIDTATGVNLDNIGDIVGQPRELIDTDLLQYFAFQGYPSALGFGNLNNSGVGGLFYSLGRALTGNVLLSDEEYRMFIKAKIMKNSGTSSPDEFLRFISFVFGVNINNVISEGNAEFTILVGKQLSAFERTLLTYKKDNGDYESSFVPKPAGVRINFGQFDSNKFFAFQGVPGAKGFGTLSDPTIGGKLATLFS